MLPPAATVRLFLTLQASQGCCNSTTSGTHTSCGLQERLAHMYREHDGFADDSIACCTHLTIANAATSAHTAEQLLLS